MFRQVRALRKSDTGWFASADALEIHVRAVALVAGTVDPPYLADTDLDDLSSPEVNTLAAVELWLAGLWRRTDGGYVITDTALIERVRDRPSRWGHRIAAAWQRIWAELNRERFIPL